MSEMKRRREQASTGTHQSSNKAHDKGKKWTAQEENTMDFLALFDGFFSSLSTVKSDQQMDDAKNTAESVDATKDEV